MKCACNVWPRADFETAWAQRTPCQEPAIKVYRFATLPGVTSLLCATHAKNFEGFAGKLEDVDLRAGAEVDVLRGPK
jgi:hypothetical protein